MGITASNWNGVTHMLSCKINYNNNKPLLTHFAK